VLTDYNPMLNIVEEMSELICQDWAEQATRDFLSAKNLGLTGCNIVKAICGGKDSIPTIQGSKPDRLQNALQTSRLVIWNYFPFARGGNQTEGKGGLPDMKDCRWISQCDKWLLSFLAAVNATTVIFAMNGFVKDARRNCHETQVNQHGLYEINDICHPRPWHTRKCACHRNRFLDEIKMA
jgi:hypothetical protein